MQLPSQTNSASFPPMARHAVNIPFTEKVNPRPYALTGWDSTTGIHLLIADRGRATARLSLTPAPSKQLFFMAEVAAIPCSGATCHTTVSITVNGIDITEWTLDSTIVHDKLVIIPETLAGIRPIEIAFAIKSTNDPGAAQRKTGTDKTGMQLHSIAISDNLDAYLNELRTGYNWVHKIRNELIDSAAYLLQLLNSSAETMPHLIDKIQSIIDSPSTVASSGGIVEFDIAYFEKKLPLLKEGKIHNAIRHWASGLQELQSIINDIGSYISRIKDIRCYDNSVLEGEISKVSLIYSEKIQIIRRKNSYLNSLEILLQKIEIESIPPILYLDITNVCNFRCRMCYQSKTNFFQTSLTNDHLITLIKLLPFFESITIGGLGEPLLGRNLDSFVREAIKLQCKITIITNGSLIHNHIETLKHFSKVSISFDGASATTFEALRHGSNFKKIIGNIKKLREQAPALSIAFSVIVSRANLDEISEIVNIGAALNINEIDLTPIEHISELTLKNSDRPVFNEQLAIAQTIADRHGILLCNSISPSSFTKNSDSPRDKEHILRHIHTLATRQERGTDINSLAERFLAQKFHYYPDQSVFTQQTPPSLPKCIQSTANRAIDNRQIEPLDIDAELARINARTDELLNEIQNKSASYFKSPYCLDPWKLSYVKSNGRNRLCCHSDIATGLLTYHNTKKSTNSIAYRKIRASMFHTKDMPSACKGCHASDRTLGQDAFNSTCAELGINPATPGLAIEREL